MKMTNMVGQFDTMLILARAAWTVVDKLPVRLSRSPEYVVQRNPRRLYRLPVLAIELALGKKRSTWMDRHTL